MVEKSERLAWFDGSSLLHYLENVHIASDRNLTEFRFPVQYVTRPNLDFRGYAGQVASGVIKPGERVMVLPSGRTSHVRSIVTYDGELEHAFPPMSVTLCLGDELDISRGDMLVPPSHLPHVTQRIDARLVWMHQPPLEIGRDYLLKHTTQTVHARVGAVRYRININTLEKEPASFLGLNDIGAVVIDTQKPIFCDPYRRNRVTGSFVLIDPLTNGTIAAGMITGRGPGKPEEGSVVSPNAHTHSMAPQKGLHKGCTIWFTGMSGAGKSTVSHLLEQKLRALGGRVEVLDGDVVRTHLCKGLGFSKEDRDENIRRIGFVCEMLARNGVVAIAAAISPYRAAREEVRARIPNFVEVFVDCPINVLTQRDVKGLYKRALAGELPHFTGISDPYEPPLHPDVTIDSSVETPEESLEKIWAVLEQRELIW